MSATANKGTLVLLRRQGETVVIGEGDDAVSITIEKVNNNKIVALKFNARKDLPINRLEKSRL